MLISQEKEKENVVEYILYMWQMEDLVRGNGLNLDLVMKNLFPENTPAEVRDEYREWFGALILELKESGLERNGHVNVVEKYMESLQDLHLSLITTFQDKDYLKLYDASRDDIKTLRNKGMSSDLSETEVCLVGLYGILLLRISKTTISPDTERALNSIGKMMSYLSEAFKKYKDGSLGLPSQMKN